MKILDNITSTVRDDLRVEIKKGSKVSIAAACFSMYAYKELKKQLESVDEFRFIFTSPTFVKEKAEKQKREFYIPRLSRETSLYGTEFEIKLRNEMTQRAIAKECADWIRKKAKFKSNTTGENMAGFMTVDSKTAQTAYMPINGFTTVDIGCERGNNSYNMVNCMEAPFAQQYMQLFDGLWNDREKMQDVTDMVLENISTAYAENSPEFIYFMTLYHVFSEFLDDISEDELPNEATGFKQSKIWSMLYDFQRDAVLAIINKLEKYNGCILADSVGLGKTFTALAVVKYYENRNKSVLVLCPKKLAENWNTYKDNYVNNPIASDRLNYDVLFHTDLSRNGGQSNGLDLNRLNWGNYDLVVIDESHNFRNGIGTHSKTQDNRYQRLMDKVIRSGVKTKVLMLSATPVNNRFVDLKNQLALAYEGNSEFLDERLNTSKNVEDIFKQAQKAFNAWSKLPQEERTTDALLRTLDFDFFELLDSVTISGKPIATEALYGYVKSPDNKDFWIIDEEAAGVVRLIFRLFLDGKNRNQIAVYLTQAQIPTPTFYMKERGRGTCKNRALNEDNRYKWNKATLTHILTRQEYCGDVVNFKTTKHFRDKHNHYVDRSQWHITENVHEPIISRSDFETVQRILENAPVKRPNGDGEIHPLSGLLFCKDCGAKMHIRIDYRNGGKRHVAFCSEYHKGKAKNPKCHSPHIMDADLLMQTIAEVLKKIEDYSISNRAEFEALVKKNLAMQQTDQTKKQQKRIPQITTRLEQIDKVLNKLYEDNALGTIPQDRYEQMSQKYSEEYYALKAELATLQEQLSAYENAGGRAQKFLKLTERHAAFTDLTPAILNEFISRIEVHERDQKRARYAIQHISIYFNYIGKFENEVTQLAEPTEQEIRQMREEIEEAKKEKSRAYHRQYSREYRARNLEKQREYDRIKAREYRAKRKAQAAAAQPTQ